MKCSLTKNRNELFDQYSCLFHPTNNRNTASHIWVNHLAHHSSMLSKDEFIEQARGFCAVSGSPISGSNEFVQDLTTTFGNTSRVSMNHCCWPCACDIKDANEQDKLHIHESTIPTAEGALDINFIVMDDPCKSSKTIPHEAPAVECSGDTLLNAVHLQTPLGSKVAIGFAFQTEDEVNYPVEDCHTRANRGYQSGMGKIFRDLLSLSKT